ncbi:Peroxisomal membrane protein PER10 [Paramyrothecium foliicola]|nr:Peroxisomal membrane protein PER10 [Paramyrothecium foliicola]
MAIREDLVASAVQFLQDPSVASSSIENRVSFLRSKNLTQEEIDVAIARTTGNVAPAPSAPYQSGPVGPPQQYYQSYPPYAWQPPPPAPKRDWRDWFIMATVVGGVSYGLYSIGKRYVYPLVAPPTPEKLEQDKKSIEDQFDKAFSLVEQLSKDTEVLKEAEKQRTEKLDTALSELETVISDLKSSNRRREDDAQRLREEVQALKDAIPKAMNNQKELADSRLKEINTELTSLKTLVSQRMTSSSSGAAVARTATPTSESGAGASDAAASETPKSTPLSTSFNRGFSTGASGGKASIPAWQMAMLNKNNDTPSTPAAGGEAESSSQNEAGASASSSS